MANHCRRTQQGTDESGGAVIFLLWLVLVGIVGYVLFVALLYRVGAPPRVEHYESVVYPVDSAAIVVRSGQRPHATVIAMHGLFEDPRYFTQFYADPDIQLILVASGDYHVPFEAARREPADWATVPASAVGTIEYDAAVLVQALERLPATRSIRVHGHSRGGAVTLEAASMRPDLFRGVDVILEAPVVPRARPHRRVPGALLWLTPMVFTLWRREPISIYNKHLFGRLDDPRKRMLIEALPSNPRRLVTVMRNLSSLEQWMERRSFDVYRNIERGTVLIADDDRVLDSGSIRASVQHAEGRLQIVEVLDCSHFILLDKPDSFPPVRKGGRATLRRIAGADAT
jgi:pimeloyl-ACP methyl ester carboxylesterase